MFVASKKIDSQTNIHEITALFLADQGYVQLPQARDYLSIHPIITKLSLSNLFSLPILKHLILPGFVKYQNLTNAEAILSEALAPLGQWTVQAANPLASWLSWQDIARIWLSIAKAPRKICPLPLQADQTWRHKDTPKRHVKGYSKDDVARAKEAYPIGALLSQRPRGWHSNFVDQRTGYTKN